MAMLGGARAVWVSEAGAAFAAAVAGLLGGALSGNVVIAEAGNLKKTAALPTLFERADNAYAIPCYEDRAEDLSRARGGDDPPGGRRNFARRPGPVAGRPRRRPFADAAARSTSFSSIPMAGKKSPPPTSPPYAAGASRRRLMNCAMRFSGATWPPPTASCRPCSPGDGRIAPARRRRQPRGAAAHARRRSGDRCARSPRRSNRAPTDFLARASARSPTQLRRWQDGALSGAAGTLAQATLATREMPALEPQIASRALLSLARQAGRRMIRGKPMMVLIRNIRIQMKLLSPAPRPAAGTGHRAARASCSAGSVCRPCPGDPRSRP